MIATQHTVDGHRATGAVEPRSDMSDEDDQRLAACFSSEADATTVVETHISNVFLVGDRAYKLKKPVSTGFLDFSDREARERACHQEVALNRRLAPDVYLGVADVSDHRGGLCDHLVVMRRMPAARRLSALVRAGDDARACVRAVARSVAAFHERAGRARDISADGSAEAVRALWDVGMAQLRPFVGGILDAADVHRMQTLAGRYINGRAALFQERMNDAHIVDGHGDLLADDIYCLDDGPRILDCLEFDPRLRHGDVLLDVAMLAMDLERLGRHDLATALLDDYREFTAGNHPASLAHHYIAYRAFVRCKVACLRHLQGDAAAAEEARGLLEIAVSHLERGRVVLVLVGGAPGAGKTTLARALSDSLDWAALRSDQVRGEIPGDVVSDAPDGFESGRYSPERSERTYNALLHRADRLLRRGESVILDATWRDAEQRRVAALTAMRAGASLLDVRCDAPAALRERRIEGRALRGSDASRATAAVAARISESFDAWPSARVVDTQAPLADQVDTVAEALAGL
jgi:uncharacterized protein